MNLLYRIFLLIIATVYGLTIQAQEILRVEGVLRIGKGEIYRIAPGTRVVFAKGARIWVEGSLIAEGSQDKPIYFLSDQLTDPGVGVVINGIETQGVVRIAYVNISGLSRPFSFEPFWARKEIVMDQLRISNSGLNEPLIYVATPMTNQNLDPILFSLTNSEFFNNNSGVIIENIGASGIRYRLNQLVFDENRVSGSDGSLGILSLNTATPYNESMVELGSLAFNKNFAGEKSIGLSLAGSGGKINAGEVFMPSGNRPIFDYSNDPRLPELSGKTKDLKEWPGQFCFIENVSHLKGLVLAKASKICSVSSLLDSNDNPITFTQRRQNDSLQIHYQGGFATTLVTQDGKRISLPLAAEQLTVAVLDTPTTAVPVIKPEPPKYEDADTTQNGPRLLKASFEIGAWGGLATYIGDLRHKFGIPGIYEWTGGLYLQYNKNRNVSYRLTFYRTNIGMHDPTAPLYIWQGAPIYVSSGGTIYQRLSFDANFKTKMYIIDVDAHYYLFPNHDYYAVKNGYTKWVYALGYGAGLMYFEPYRCVIYPSPGQEAVYMPSRQLGMEGQNFLKSKGKYWPVALNFNVSTQVVYAITKKIRFKYEFKAVLSMSDYIDDYGQGFTYGGDFEKWKNSLGNVQMPINQKTGQPYTADDLFPAYNSTIKRTFNLLPDMFFQQHIGVSYDIGDVYTKYWKNRKKGNSE